MCVFPNEGERLLRGGLTQIDLRTCIDTRGVERETENVTQPPYCKTGEGSFAVETKGGGREEDFQMSLSSNGKVKTCTGVRARVSRPRTTGRDEDLGGLCPECGKCRKKPRRAHAFAQTHIPHCPRHLPRHRRLCSASRTLLSAGG